MKDIILRDAKMCAYVAGNVEHFKYLMKRLGYIFKKDAWMEVQAPGFPYYHKLAKLYRLRIVEQKCFVVGGAKYTEDLKRFHQLQDEYLLLVNNDIKSVEDLVDFINEQEEKIQQIEDRQHEIYRESSSWKRKINTEAQYREYQIFL